MHKRSGYIYVILFLLCSNALHAQLPDSIPTGLRIAANTDPSKSLFFVDDLVVTGYKKTKQYIIEREIPFRKGDSISAVDLGKKIKLCHDQLMNTSLFVDVNVAIVQNSGNHLLISVNVKERWYLFPLPYFKIVARNINDWWVTYNHSLNRVNYGVKFMQNNVSGRNDHLNIWLINGYTQQASIRYENPFLDKSLKHGMNIGILYSRNREINYTTHADTFAILKTDFFLFRQFHVDAAYSYRPAIRTRHNFRVSYTDQLIHDTVVKRNPKYFPGNLQQTRYFDLSYSIQYFNVDYIPYPLRGFMGEASVYKRGIGSENNMYQVSARGTFTASVLPKTFLQFQGAGLIRFPFNQPYSNLRLLGFGDLTLRGLEYYVIDGVAGAMLRGTAKRQMISFDIRNPIKTKNHDKIPFRIFLKAYSDVGYAHNRFPVNSIFNNKLLHTAGFGADVLTFYDVVVKFEYSFNQRGESGFFIHTASDF